MGALHRACIIAEKIAQLNNNIADAWLEAASEIVGETLADVPLFTQTLIVTPADDGVSAVEHAGCAGAQHDPLRQQLLEFTVSEYNVAATERPRRPGVGKPDERRRGLGAHYSVTADASFLGADSEAHVLALRVDSLSKSWRPTCADVCVLETGAIFIARAFDRQILARRALQQRLLRQVSPAQRMVAPLLAEGLGEIEIAKRLDRSKHTIHDHIKAIYRAWGVRSRHELLEVWTGRRVVEVKNLRSDSQHTNR